MLCPCCQWSSPPVNTVNDHPDLILASNNPFLVWKLILILIIRLFIKCTLKHCWKHIHRLLSVLTPDSLLAALPTAPTVCILSKRSVQMLILLQVQHMLHIHTFFPTSFSTFAPPKLTPSPPLLPPPMCFLLHLISLREGIPRSSFWASAVCILTMMILVPGQALQPSQQLPHPDSTLSKLCFQEAISCILLLNHMKVLYIIIQH